MTLLAEDDGEKGMNSRILNFFNVKLDAFIVFVSVVVVIMFIALFFLLLDYLKMRKRYVEFMTGESGKSLEYYNL